MIERPGFFAVASAFLNHPIVEAGRPFDRCAAWHQLLAEAALKARTIRAKNQKIRSLAFCADAIAEAHRVRTAADHITTRRT